MKGGLGVTPLLAKVLIRSLDGFQVSCPLALAVLARNLQQKIPGLSRSSSIAGFSCCPRHIGRNSTIFFERSSVVPSSLRQTSSFPFSVVIPQQARRQPTLQQADIVGWSDGVILGLDLAMRHPKPSLAEFSAVWASHQSRFRSTYPRLDHAPDQIGKKGRNHPKG
jgi:hypothetical protein